MNVLLKLFFIFGLSFAIEAKFAKNVKRFGEMNVVNNFNSPILASVTRVNAKLEPVSLPFLANINPNLNSRIQPAFTFVEPGLNPLKSKVNKNPKAEDSDYFSSNAKVLSKVDKDSDEDIDENSDYFGANDIDNINEGTNGQIFENESDEDGDYFLLSGQDPENEPGNDKNSDKNGNSKFPTDDIDNYIDHDDSDEFYDDQVNSTVLRRTSSNADVDDNEQENIFKCDHIICPSKTSSCKSTVEAVGDEYSEVEVMTECLSSTNEVLATKTSKSDNPSIGKYLRVVQTMNNESDIQIRYFNQTKSGLWPLSSGTNLRRTSESAQDTKSKRRKVQNKLRRSKARFNMRKGNDDADEEEPPVLITEPQKEDFDNFLQRKFDPISVIQGNSSGYHNITSRYNQMLNDDEEPTAEEEQPAEEESTAEEELNLVESEELICVGVHCPKEAFKCKTFDDSVPPEFNKIQIVVQCLTRDDVMVHTETLEKENFQKGVYMHSESLLNRYGELNTMAEHFVID
ncbi:unnamed protein product [Diamesa tonsa]